ncbi:hypothetical protein CBS147355_6045 [Penicillium roqueforti]|nr:hypothetical protein CBS147355_6045 [Penicillium roqueforti]KAI3251736.1 hypothetical protein CBS147309_8101 [Penicillium roqueforti]
MSTDLPNSGPSGEPARKGSVKRARQMLDAGVRPERASPPQMRQPPVPRNISHQAQWPLPDTGLPPHPANQHPRYLVPRGPPPQRPPHPGEMPSPSIYSERDSRVSEMGLPPRSSSQPQPSALAQSHRPIDNTPASPTSTIDLTPRISIATEDLFRQSVASDMPQFPPTSLPAESDLSQDEPRHRTAGLVAPLNSRRPPRARRSSVSPIPEELAHPRFTKCSVASSRAIPSWGSGPAESEILGAYDIDSDDGQRSPGFQEDDTRLVRNASIGKRGKPTMRTILKSNPVSVVDMPAPTQEESAKGTTARSVGLGAAASQAPHIPSQLRKSSTTSSEPPKGLNLEKPPLSTKHESLSSNAQLEKELEAFGQLPNAAPTMSDKRPGGRKPPALNMHALRDAEARGSLSSLSDLIRRATKLASNLDHGRTASRANLAGDEAGFKGMGHRPRNSGSLSEMLASFPPPGLATPEARGSTASWPVFFGRSNLRNVEQLNSSDDDPNAPRRKKTCCGIPRKIFVLICVVIFIIVILAVLLPVFLVAVPRENASTPCAEKNPCENGGVSVSAGTQCSCICSNGYIGSQCTVLGDGSCTTALISDGSNATMGSALPVLFNESKEKFNITLDPVTIMALFNMNDVTCTTENALVAFSAVTTDTSKTRRSVNLVADSMPSVSKTDPTPVLAARSEATMNGILYDDSESSKTATTTSAPTQTESATSASATKASSQTTAAAASTSTAISVPDKVVGFSRIAVLYILQKTGSLDTALSSEEDIEEYLADSYANATQPAMKVGAFAVDFEKLTITLPNSTVKAE